MNQIFKKKFTLKADLHCHTRASFDGFSSPKEILDACIKKGINTLAITEHDLINKIDKYQFSKNNIFLIDGCEFTTDKGAHIIGLFIKNSIFNGTITEVIQNIKEQDGLILIPHPFKPISGVCKVYEDLSQIFEKSDLIELFNGGYENTNLEEKKIHKIASQFNIKLIANSDSHKINQFGYYMTQFETIPGQDIKEVLKNSKPICFKDFLLTKPRKLNSFQKSKIYQIILKFIPKYFRRILKLIQYDLKKKVIRNPLYKRIY